MMQVKQLVAVDGWVADQFPAIIADCALDVPVAKYQFAACRLTGVTQDFCEIDSFTRWWSGDRTLCAEGWHEIEQIAHGGSGLIGSNAGASDDERDADGIEFIEILFADQAMAAAGDARVGAKYDDGIGGIRGVIEGIEDAADLRIEKRDVAPVISDHLLGAGSGARVGEQQFIAHRHFAVIEWMLGHEILWQECGIRRVMKSKVMRHDVRVMRTIKGNVTKKWLIVVVLDELHGFIGKYLTRVFGCDGRSTQLAVLKLAKWGVERVGHATVKYRSRLLETGG